MLPFPSCPPESMRGFFLRGAGVGASPVSHEGIWVESRDSVSAGTAGFFFPSPIILPSTCNNAENNDYICLLIPTKSCSIKNVDCTVTCYFFLSSQNLQYATACTFTSPLGSLGSFESSLILGPSHPDSSRLKCRHEKQCSELPG